MAKLYSVEASVHKRYGEAYRVKVSILDLGVYINGMMIYPPNEDHDGWAVLTPARPAGRGKYARIVEFNKQLPLWEHVYEACVDAVKIEMANEQQDIAAKSTADTFAEDYRVTDIPF